MTNPAAEARVKAQGKWPGATVISRLRNQIVHQHPSNPRKRMLDVSIGPIHYGAGEDQEIDTAWEISTTQPWLWQMVKAGFNVYAGPGTTDFDAGQILRYVHPDSGEDVTFQAQQLQWTNDLDQIEAIADPQQVGHSAIVDDVIFWDGAFGPGLDFRWQAQTARLSKYLTIQNATAIGTPPQFIIDGGNPVLKLAFIFQKSAGVDIYIDGQLWNEKSNNPQTTTDNAEFRLNATGETLWHFKRASGSDNSFEGQATGIQTRYRAQAQNLLVEVLVPWSWLETAVFPVEIDPTIDEQVGASADDGNEEENSTNFSYTTDNINHNSRTTTNNRWNGGHRFVITGPASEDTVDVAYVEMYSYNVTVDDPNFTGSFEDVDNADDFATTQDVTDRIPTTATSSYVATSVGIGWWGSGISIAAPLQEIFDRPGWSSGNAAVFLGRGNADINSAFVIRGYDYDTTLAVKLHLEYTAGGGLAQSLAGALNASGGIVKATSTTRAGALTITGTAAKKTAKLFVGSLASSGALAGAAIFLRSLAGSMITSGTVTKKAVKSFVGSLALSGTVVKGVRLRLSGVQALSGTIAKKTAKSFAGSLANSGVLGAVKQVGLLFKSLAGTLASSGAIAKKTATTRAGSLATSGTIAKGLFLTLAGSLPSSGTIAKGAAKNLAGSLSFSGAANGVKAGVGAFFKSIGGTLDTTGTITKKTAKEFAGSLESSGAIAKGIYFALAGVLAASGNVGKGISLALVGTLTSSGAIARKVSKKLAGSFVSSGALIKATSVTLSGSLASTGTIAKGIAKSLAGTLVNSGVVSTLLNPTREVIALTLRARSVALELPNRTYALSLRARAYALKLFERD